MEKEVISTTGLKKTLMITMIIYVGFVAVGPLMVAFQIFRVSEKLALPSIESVLIPPLKGFGIGLMASLVIGKWATSRLAAHFKSQHMSQGVIPDNQNSLFANFGFNLGMGALIGLSLADGYFCNTPITEDISGSLSIRLNCQTLINSASTFFVGILTGFGLWLIYQVSSIEKEMNQIMIVQHYTTNQWSLIMITVSAIVIYVVGFAFYKIFTLS